MPGSIVELSDREYIVITQMDFQKQEGTFKIFFSFNEANDWVHEGSLKQLPEWHKERCEYCKKKN